MLPRRPSSRRGEEDDSPRPGPSTAPSPPERDSVGAVAGAVSHSPCRLPLRLTSRANAVSPRGTLLARSVREGRPLRSLAGSSLTMRQMACTTGGILPAAPRPDAQLPTLAALPIRAVLAVRALGTRDQEPPPGPRLELQGEGTGVRPGAGSDVGGGARPFSASAACRVLCTALHRPTPMPRRSGEGRAATSRTQTIRTQRVPGQGGGGGEREAICECKQNHQSNSIDKGWEVRVCSRVGVHVRMPGG